MRTRILVVAGLLALPLACLAADPAMEKLAADVTEIQARLNALKVNPNMAPPKNPLFTPASSAPNAIGPLPIPVQARDSEPAVYPPAPVSESAQLRQVAFVPDKPPRVMLPAGHTEAFTVLTTYDDIAGAEDAMGRMETLGLSPVRVTGGDRKVAVYVGPYESIEKARRGAILVNQSSLKNPIIKDQDGAIRE